MERFRRHICDLVPTYRSRSVCFCCGSRLSNLHIRLWTSRCEVVHVVCVCRLLFRLASHIGGVVVGSTGACNISVRKGTTTVAHGAGSYLVRCVSRCRSSLRGKGPCGRFPPSGWHWGSRAGGFCRARRFCAQPPCGMGVGVHGQCLVARVRDSLSLWPVPRL